MPNITITMKFHMNYFGCSVFFIANPVHFMFSRIYCVSFLYGLGIVVYILAKFSSTLYCKKSYAQFK